MMENLKIKNIYTLEFQLNNHLAPAMPIQKRNGLCKTSSARKEEYENHNLMLPKLLRPDGKSM